MRYFTNPTETDILMKQALAAILNWSEIWALIIPLFVLLLRKKQPDYMRPVILYLGVALLLNIAGDYIEQFNKNHHSFSLSNNPIYNLHSVIRFACFSYFFILLRQPFFTGVKKLIPLVYVFFVLIDFVFFENFFNGEHLSGTLLATEAYLLLIYCLLYYLSRLREEVKGMKNAKDFWVVTGLAIYVVANFFVFLFYVPMIKENPQLANNMWDIHNVAYIFLCIFISKAFYVPVAN